MVHPVAYGRPTHFHCLEQRNSPDFFREGDVVEHREVLLRGGEAIILSALVCHVQIDDYGVTLIVRRKTQYGSIAYCLWPSEILGRRRTNSGATGREE